MKAKITKGQSFKAIVKYIFSPGEKDKKDRAEWIGGTLASDNPDGLIKEFAVVQRLKPELKNPSWHCSLTLPKGEYLSQNQWTDVVEDFMEKMEFDKHTPYAIVRHNDTELDHVHIVASRIPMVGPAWRDGRDIFRAIAATQELEKEYGLTQTSGYRKRESARVTYRERKKAETSGVTPPRIQLQELIDEAVVGNPTAPELSQRLEDAGVIVRASIASNGKMNGFSFELDGLAFSGSKLGKSYGWGGLRRRGVTYDAERDATGIERYRSPVSERPPRISGELEESTPIYIDIDIDIEKPEISSKREEQYKTEQTGEKSPTERLQELIDEAVVGNPTAPEFAQRLEDAGVAVRANVASTGRMSGFSFELDGRTFKGSSLGKAYGWGGLQKRGVVYDIERDAADLEMYRLPFEERSPRLEEKVAESAPIYIDIEKPEASVEPDSPDQEQPEPTQPFVESSALSEALTETSPTLAAPSALSKAPSQEAGQQQQWVENLCPQLANLLNHEGISEIKGRRRTIAWDEEQLRLTVRANKSQEVVLDAEWDEVEERWKDNGSSLTMTDFEDISRGLEQWLLEREREREQQQRSGGGLELG